MEYPVSACPVYIVADSIISSLGFTTRQNLEAMLNYQSGITQVTDETLFSLPFLAARIQALQLDEAVKEKNLSTYCRLEQLFILSILDIVKQSGIDLSDPANALVFSTTKGNIDVLAGKTESLHNTAFLSVMADRVAAYFGSLHRPVIISNACISGVSAIVLASRMITSGRYKQVLVTGGDLLTRFVITGFQSFKSVSKEICKPYDQVRNGLTLGEACASILLTGNRTLIPATQTPVLVEGGCITNDANHISGPSRTGDGLHYAITRAMNETGLKPKDISFVNMHGTATIYNDEMEAKAIHLSGLEQVPVNSLKPYWGHTLGASGIIESIACIEQLKRRILLATPGFEVLGVEEPLLIENKHRSLDTMKRCIKTASGFGGCNAAVVFALETATEKEPVKKKETIKEKACTEALITRHCIIREGKITVDGICLFESDARDAFAAFIRSAFKLLDEQNMKFYKMDNLCKLGYVAAAYLLKDRFLNEKYAPEEIGIILSNSSSSLDTDCKHQEIIDEKGDQEASPAVFVYTLPNVVAGEICIRYKIQGENTFFISKDESKEQLEAYCRFLLDKHLLKVCIFGRCELLGNQYHADFYLMEKQ